MEFWDLGWDAEGACFLICSSYVPHMVSLTLYASCGSTSAPRLREEWVGRQLEATLG